MCDCTSCFIVWEWVYPPARTYAMGVFVSFAYWNTVLSRSARVSWLIVGWGSVPALYNMSSGRFMSSRILSTVCR